MLLLILIILKEILQIPGYAVGVAAVLWIVKDAALYPFVGRFYDPSLQTYKFTMIGKIGIVKEPLTPKGKILVNGELWQAEATENRATVKTGEKVLVQGMAGLKLLVQPERDQKKPDEKVFNQDK
jgi:membrane protein implicated in regulation of membrane protease activity